MSNFDTNLKIGFPPIGTKRPLCAVAGMSTLQDPGHLGMVGTIDACMSASHPIEFWPRTNNGRDMGIIFTFFVWGILLQKRAQTVTKLFLQKF